MSRAVDRLRPVWQLLRHRRPAAAAQVEQTALAARGRGALVAEVQALRGRVAELQRDHLLLAAHVAALTEQVGRGDARGEAADAAARDRARLAAIAAYEERIGALERLADRRDGRRDGGSGRASGPAA